MAFPRLTHDIIAVPYVRDLIEPGSRYGLDDPRIPPAPPPAAASTERRDPREVVAGARASRIAFRVRLEARLAKDGLLRPLANTDELEPIIGRYRRAASVKVDGFQ